MTTRAANSLEAGRVQDADVVEPHHVLGKSFPCQRQAAHIYTEYNKARGRNDIAEVAYRGQQARRGRASTSREALIWGGVATVSAVPVLVYGIVSQHYYMLGLCAGALPAAVHCGVNIGNAWRYAEIKDGAQEILTGAVGDEMRALDILDMPANRQFADALETAGVDTRRMREAHMIGG